MEDSQTSSLTVKDIDEQIVALQREIKEHKDTLQNEPDCTKTQSLLEMINNKESLLANLQSSRLNSDEPLRRSERQRVMTEKMLAYHAEEVSKKEKRLISLYERWKIQTRKIRAELKDDVSEQQLMSIIDILENGKNDIMKIYDEIREHVTPQTELRRKIDACEAVTSDILKVVYERLTGIDGEFDAEREKLRLRELINRDYAHSIFGSVATQSSVSGHSESTCMSAKRADAAAELAAKKANYRMLQEEIKQRERMRTLEEQHKRELEIQKSELERIKAEKDIEVARARLEAYDGEINQVTNIQPIRRESENQYNIPPFSAQQLHNTDTSHLPSDVSFLAKAIQDSITTNRLPMPEPAVFNGDPVQFVEWKSSFMSLIDRKGISPADKLYYLKRYISGPALRCIEGTFFRSDEEAYKDAWDKLNQRYGHVFVIQKAFRERLAKWPKIQSRDAEGLRNFSDFLNTCLQAMPHVKGLEILHDCEENQKLIQKLPDWTAARWNRRVTVALMQNQEFPSFHDFVTFISTEAEIACNPVTSIYALRSSEQSCDKRNPKETKRNRASVFSTQTAVDSDKQVSVKGITRAPCILCGDSKHQLHKCPDLMNKSLEERRSYIRDKKLCYGCVKLGHSAKECRHRHICDVCKGRHPTCLHDDNFTKRVKAENSVYTKNETQTNATGITTAVSLSVGSVGQTACTTMIVPVWLSSVKEPSKEKLVYALLDTQSDTTFVDQDVSNELQADTYPVKLKLTTMIGENMVMQSERVTGLRVRSYSSAIHIDLPAAYTKDCIPVNRDHIPSHEMVKGWSHLAVIADKIPPLLNCEIGLLIGYNCSRALAPKQVILGRDEQPYAVQTDLGWSIVGCSPCIDTPAAASLCHRVAVKELPYMTPLDAIHVLESDFKDIEENDKGVSQNDLIFLEKLKEGISINDFGHYEMPLPFKKRPYLPDNKSLAEVRLNHLKRKLSRDEKYKQDYIQYMKDIIERGDVEEVHDNGVPGETWYIPHHGIYHPKKPEKLRVVFDCSAKHKGTSLNEHLLPGPDMINNLTGVLIRFRQYPIALMCDIEKMFHQFHVREEDRNYFRFLWWKDGDLSAQPQDYRMRVHLFGAASSPGCANYGLKHLAKENSHSFPLASQFIANDFYVDDGVTSTETVKKAIQLTTEARELCARVGLRLHKFVSNSSTVLDSIPSSEHATDTKTKDLTFNGVPVERALGTHWSVENDCFMFSLTLKDQPNTRRGILSTIASIYDPLGFIAPFVLNGKRILQEMCRQGSGWDDPLSEELKPRWESWKNDFINLERINVPRCYLPPNFGKVVKTELHHFSDASSIGYGQCSYRRQKNSKGDVHCVLIIGKSRVSPTKLTTIPRLELTAAVVSVKVSLMLKEEFGYSNVEEFFWTDSKVVLGYINNEARRFHTFVANRVQKIRQSTSPQQWFYVPTDENPADRASRGAKVNELLLSNWFRGPTFLWEKDLQLPVDVVPELPIGDPEIRKVQTLSTKSVEQACLLDRLSKFSSWSWALRAVARLLRLVKKDKSISLCTVSEREDAERLIIRQLQNLSYQKEIKQLSKGNQLPNRNPLHHLDPFLDEHGILKVGGRLGRSSFPNLFKHPVVIPKEHHITKLIIAHCHESVKHQGKGFTINAVRSSGYWIPGISRAVASHIHQCVICRRLRRCAEGQRMSDLPVERVEPSPPFAYCGMDCFGPFFTKQDRKEHKRYGLLFTCFCSRAIHIELLEDMSTDAFINALRCFIAIRGAVRQIKSDQGTNFVGARNEFHSALAELDVDRLSTFLVENQCDFVMNAPHSSHAGGVWERQIRTVRGVLNSTLALSSRRLSDTSLRTLFYEAMAIVNSRPLTVDDLNNPNSLEPLTPNHLITIKPTTALPPPGKFVKEDLYGRKRWRQIQYLAEQFWSRWKKEYIHNIRVRQRWHASKRNIQIGDVVKDVDELTPRNEWRMGRVLETVTDKDGLVRRVRICFGDRNLNNKGERLNKPSVVERPVQKLVVLLEAK